MQAGHRCDEIVRMFDEALADAVCVEAEVGDRREEPPADSRTRLLADVGAYLAASGLQVVG